MRAIKPLLEVQQQWSGLPRRDTLLAETLKSREGWHLFLYPFAGRHVHLGLGSLLAWRLSRHQPLTFSIAVNDYGLELLSASEIDWAQTLQAELFSETDLLADIIASLNAGELACGALGNRAHLRAGVFRLPWRGQEQSSAAGIQRAVLRGVQAIRR